MSNHFLQDDFTKIRYSYDLGVQSDNPNARRAIAELLEDFAGHGPGYVSAYNADRAVMDVVDHVTREHLAHGRCLAELHVIAEPDEPSQTHTAGPSGFARLSVVPGATTRTRFGRVQQQEPKGGWTSFKTAHLVSFDLPDGLGRELHTVAKLLAKAERVRPDDLQPRMDPTNYSTSAHWAGQRKAMAIITASIGWDGRQDSILNEPSASYALWRDLKFRRTWLQAATATIATLNTITSSTDYLHSPFDFAITGLPGHEELSAGMDALRSGAESVDSVRNRLIYPRYNNA